MWPTYSLPLQISALDFLFLCIVCIKYLFNALTSCTKPGGQESTCLLCLLILHRRDSWEYGNLER